MSIEQSRHRPDEESLLQANKNFIDAFQALLGEMYEDDLEVLECFHSADSHVLSFRLSKPKNGRSRLMADIDFYNQAEGAFSIASFELHAAVTQSVLEQLSFDDQYAIGQAAAHDKIVHLTRKLDVLKKKQGEEPQYEQLVRMQKIENWVAGLREILEL